MDLFSLTREDLYQELAVLAKERHVLSQVEWDGLVDEMIDARNAAGDLNREHDFVGLKKDLSSKWEEYNLDQEPEAEESY